MHGPYFCLEIQDHSLINVFSQSGQNKRAGVKEASTAADNAASNCWMMDGGTSLRW